MSGSTVFWYSSRATGIVALLLFTAVLFLGIFVTRQGKLPGLPGFAVTSLHRNLSLLGLAFIVIHVLTAWPTAMSASLWRPRSSPWPRGTSDFG